MEKEKYEIAKKIQLAIRDLGGLKENMSDYILIPDSAKKVIVKTIEEEIIKLQVEFNKI